MFHYETILPGIIKISVLNKLEHKTDFVLWEIAHVIPTSNYKNIVKLE